MLNKKNPENKKINSQILVEAPKLCRACGQANISNGIEIVNGFLEGTSFEAVTCINCGTMQTGVGDSEDLTKMYNSIYNHSSVISGYKRYNLYGWFSSNPLFRFCFDIFYAEKLYFGAYKFIDEKSKQVQRKLKILEIGSGLGYTTARLRKLGHEVIGCDLSSDACSRATKLHGGEFICGTVELIKQKHGRTFDIIVCLEVIEHVENPFVLLSDFKSILNNDGRAIITTPNLLSKSNWNTTEPPIHLSYFTIRGFKKLIHRLNCDAHIIIFEGRYRRNKKDNYREELPGSVLMMDFLPNTEYFDYGDLTINEKIKILVKNQINKIYYRYIDRARISNIVDIEDQLISTSIVVSVNFSNMD